MAPSLDPPSDRPADRGADHPADAADARPGLDPALDAALAASTLLPLPEGFVPAVMAGLPARPKTSPLPALVRVAAAVLVAIGVSLVLQGLSPTVARAEAPALLRDALAPVVTAVPRPTLDPAASLEVLPGRGTRDAEGRTVLGVAGLGLALLGAGLLLARRTLTRAPPPSNPVEVRP